MDIVETFSEDDFKLFINVAVSFFCVEKNMKCTGDCEQAVWKYILNSDLGYSPLVREVTDGVNYEEIFFFERLKTEFPSHKIVRIIQEEVTLFWEKRGQQTA